MKHSIKTLLAIACVFTLLAASCEKEQSDKGQGNAKAAKLTIELLKYYNSTGSIGFKNWERGDKVAAFNATVAENLLKEGVVIRKGKKVYHKFILK